jgi:hypothetical protein
MQADALLRRHSTEGQMADTTNFRRERIEKLLHELRYEVERGMLERDIDETMGFRFVVPISREIPDGTVFCEFRTRPMPRGMMNPDYDRPRLQIVKKSDKVD